MLLVKNYLFVLVFGRIFFFVGLVVIMVWKCGIKIVLVIFCLMIKVWVIVILGILLKI